MAEYNGPVAKAIEDILDEHITTTLGGDLIGVLGATSDIVDLVTGFMLAGWDQGHTLEQAMHAWQRGAVG